MAPVPFCRARVPPFGPSRTPAMVTGVPPVAPELNVRERAQFIAKV